MLPDPNIFGPATLAMSQGIGAFMTFLPKISEIRAAHPSTNPDIAADVRMGEVAASTLTLGVGLVASSLTGSPVPAFVALIVCIVLITLFESILRADHPLEHPTRHLTLVKE